MAPGSRDSLVREMKVHIGGTPDVVATFLEPFMKGVSKGFPGHGFQLGLSVNESSKFERLEDGVIEVTTDSQHEDLPWTAVYRVELSAARPGTNLNFKLVSFSSKPRAPRAMASAVTNVAASGSKKREWEKEFTRYVQRRTGPALRMTVQPEQAVDM